ncbi:MAG: peptidase [Acidimicrobiia bacterium]|nr:peptidase [Acidimicrobiia bacterium]
MSAPVVPRSSATTSETKRATQKWSRLVHVYTSMIALLLVLFFGVTGVTLNHPTWSIGSSVSTSTSTGTLAVAPTMGDGAVAWLPVSEYARAELGVSGEVEGFDSTGGSAAIRYRKPGYAADLTFSLSDARYELVTTQQGWFFGILNDLHKGRYADTSWKWVIDVSGILLVVMALAGIVLQLMLRRRRTSAFVVAGFGAVLTIVLAAMTVS